jgi:hypothetical protein
MIVSQDLIGFHTDKGVLAHPFDLSSERGKAVQTVGLIRKLEGEDVWLIIARASQPPGTETSKKIMTLLAIHFANKHETPLPRPNPQWHPDSTMRQKIAPEV